MSAAADRFRRPIGVVAIGLLACCSGCASERTTYTLGAEHPEIVLAMDGLYFAGERISAADLIDRLEDADIPKTRTIHILQARDLRDLRRSRALLTLLARGGYTRAVFVTRRHGESMTVSRRPGGSKDGKQNRLD